MTAETEALTVIPPEPQAPLALFGTNDPSQVIEVAARVATSLAEVVNKRGLFAIVNGKKFPTVEAWTLLGAMLGVFPVTEWSRPLLDDSGNVRGYEARVVAKTLNGRTVGAGEAMCVRGESKTWHANAQEFAVRSMAQTRATSKALRGPLDFVFKLAGFQPTPAEEMSETAQTGEIPTAQASKESQAALKAAASQGVSSEGTSSAPPAAAELNSSAGAGQTSPPSTTPSGPRAKRGNVVKAPQGAQSGGAAAATPPANPVAASASPVALIDDLDGKEEYLATLREQARQVAAKLQRATVVWRNTVKNKEEIALGRQAPEGDVADTPNPGSDAALAAYIDKTIKGRTLLTLTEDELADILNKLEDALKSVEARLK